jgi:hypothetical protein
VNENAFATRVAVVAAPAEPSDGDTIANRETFDALAQFGYLPCDFMPGG